MTLDADRSQLTTHRGPQLYLGYDSFKLPCSNPARTLANLFQCLARVRGTEVQWKREYEAKTAVKICMKHVQIPQYKQSQRLALMNTC
jgi:hypothetical protein